MLDRLKLVLKSNYTLFKAVRVVLAVTGFFKAKQLVALDDFWNERIASVLASPDNQHLPRVSNAGTIRGDVQYMHNGLKIHVGSYYGDGNTVLLARNKGVHEPQEEKVFEEIIELLPPGAVMLELGSFWAFYSMTFQKKVARAKNYLIEPDPHALISGKHNFRLNGLRGFFFNAFVSDEVSTGDVPTTSVDHFLTSHKIEKLHLLHSDIQGFELKMLMGAKQHLQQAKIDYVFISTHSNQLHNDCIEFLSRMNYTILCDADLDGSFSGDGLIVAKHSSIEMPRSLTISQRQ